MNKVLDKDPEQNIVKEILRLYSSRDYDQAKKNASELLKSYPNSSVLLNILGVIFNNQGDYDVAIKYYNSAIKINPNNADVYNNFGSTLCKKGNFKDGLDQYEKATKIKPDFTLAYENAGKAAIFLEKYDSAINNFINVIKLQPDNIGAVYNLALSYFKIGKLNHALEHCNQALNLNPQMVEAIATKSKILAKLVPNWHVPMMNDDDRNNFYFSALKSTINKEESSILEIGTGSGLLSIMASNLGAKEINTCEANSEVARIAIKVISENNLGDKINVIQKKSNDVKVGLDISKPADILLSEILSSEFLGEGVLPTLEDAKKRLISKNAKIIPELGGIMISLFGGDEIGKNIHTESFKNIKFKNFNMIIPKKHYLFRQDLKILFMSKPIEVFHFDFVEKQNFPREDKKILIEAIQSGKCYGVIQWIKLGMKNGLSYENDPSKLTSATSWQQVLYLFEEPIELKTRQKVSIVCKHDRNTPWFFLDKIND